MKSALPIIAAASILLAGCDELEVEETHNFGDEMYENNYTLVNTTDLEVDYYMANTDLFGDAQEVKDSKYYVDTLASQSPPVDVIHAHNERSRISFYVVDHSDTSNSATQMYQVAQDQPYHFIAWQNAEKLRLTLVKKANDNKDDFFAIRILATENLRLKVEKQLVNLYQNQLSYWYHIDDCADDLKISRINDEDKRVYEPVSICDASYGQSYTLLLSEDGLEASIAE
ncbi:hypothetical protein [Pseudoalteromonas sp. GB43]